MIRALPLFAALALAGPSQAASLEALRAQTQGAAERLERARAERESAEKALSHAARRIEARKARRAQGPALWTDPELEELLRHSQQLSDRLDRALRQERDAERFWREGQDSLAEALDRELETLHGRFEALQDSGERRQLVPQMRALRAERNALRRPAAWAPIPRFEQPSDDPEELLERADALLDSADKLRREEAELVNRIARLRRERELERRMNDFLGENALFDESDRRIAVRRSQVVAASSGTEANGSASRGDQGRPASSESPYGRSPNPFLPGSESLNLPTPEPPSPPTLEPAPQAQVVTRYGEHWTPPVRDLGRGLRHADEEDLAQLEARLARVRALAQEMERSAEQAARRAIELE